MRIVGEWLLCDDGITRPTVRAYVGGDADEAHGDDFLIDSGADRSVFAASLARRLRLPGDQPPPELSLLGIGGDTPFVLVNTGIEFVRDDGGTAIVRGVFAAFTDAQATDLSILGRDVLDNFDVILSRRRDEVLLLAPNHQYQVSRI
jgi:hypothetical protein